MAKGKGSTAANSEETTARALGFAAATGDGGEDQAVANVEQPVEGTVVTYGPAMQTIVDWLAQRAAADDEDTLGAMERIIGETLAADNPDEVLSAKLPIHARDVTDRPMLLHGFKLNEGDFEEGSPFYAVMDVTYGLSPEPHVVTSGAWRVLAQLKRLEELGEWPQAIVFREKQTRAKKGVLFLERPKV